MKDIAILIAIPFFVLTLLAEYLYFRFKKQAGEKFEFADTLTNLSLGLGSHIASMIYGFIFIVLYDYFYTNFSFFQVNSWLWLPVVIVAYDFVYYWAHRWGHEWNVFWGAHVVHHQSKKYNLSVALRQPWFHNLIAFPLFSMFPFIGIETKVFFAAGVFVTLYQYWIHTEVIRKMPHWFEFIFNTPSHHRVHHATNPQYIDKNYAAVFIIWDRVFNTFEPEMEQPIYGITTPYTSLNPFKANFYYFLDIIKSARTKPGVWHKLRLLFMPPASLSHTEKLQPVATPTTGREHKHHLLSPTMKIYLLFQFALLVVGFSLLLYHFESLTKLYQYMSYTLIFASITSLWFFLELKPWAKYFELFRITVCLIGINAIYYTMFIHWFWYMLCTLVVVYLFSVSFIALERSVLSFTGARMR